MKSITTKYGKKIAIILILSVKWLIYLHLNILDSKAPLISDSHQLLISQELF